MELHGLRLGEDVLQHIPAAENVPLGACRGCAAPGRQLRKPGRVGRVAVNAAAGIGGLVEQLILHDSHDGVIAAAEIPKSGKRFADASAHVGIGLRMAILGQKFVVVPSLHAESLLPQLQFEA